MTGALCNSPRVHGLHGQTLSSWTKMSSWPWHVGRSYCQQPAAHASGVSAALGALQLQLCEGPTIASCMPEGTRPARSGLRPGWHHPAGKGCLGGSPHAVALPLTAAGRDKMAWHSW